ncbi:MAG: radical SAM protein [Anaerolineae bacterium]|nr:radical SAM protein [Anaerolineae bacterium]
MKVLVANPPWPGPGYGARSDVRWPHKRSDKYIEYPIYLSYTVAVVEEAGFDVSFIDAIMDELDIEGFARQVADLAPRLALIETSTPSIDWDLQTAQAIKQWSPETFVALLGSHVTYFDVDTVAGNPAVDAVLRGEFEYTAAGLARVLQAGAPLSTVQGLTYRDADGQVRRNADRPLFEPLDKMPFPARHIVKGEGYRAGIYSGGCPTAMVSSRGCPYHCTFCLWPDVLYGHKFRARSARNVVDEIEQAARTYGHDEIYFDDDTFTIDKQRVMDITRLILERGLEKEVEWIAQCRVDTVDREMLEAMKAANCGYILYGVESGSPEMLKKMRKAITPDKVQAAFELTRQVGIKTQAFFLFGMPGETHDTIRETIEFAKALNASSTQFAIAIPHPGTALYKECKANGWLTSEVWADYTAENSLIETPWLTAEEVEQARIRAYREYYYRPRFVVGEALKVRRLADVQRLLRGANSVRSRLRFFQQAHKDTE